MPRGSDNSPGTGPKRMEPTVDTAKSSAPAHPSSHEKLPKPDDTIEAHYASLESLEDRLAHELLSDEERQELRDRVIGLRRKLSR